MQQEFKSSILKILDRDLQKLESEMRLYPTEESIWEIQGEIKNSGGNLCLHLCGNLQHFIGYTIGGIPYQRNREYEFSAKGIIRDELIAEIQKTKSIMARSLEKITEPQLVKEYPVQVLGYPMSTLYFIIHLTAHLEYHLGQINYHRRLLNGQLSN